MKIKEGYLFVSRDMVCKSAAGYYLGRYCYEYYSGNPEDKNNWCLQPYSRCSGYYSNFYLADSALRQCKLDGEIIEMEEEFHARFILFRKYATV